MSSALPARPSSHHHQSLHYGEAWQNSNGFAAALRARSSESAPPAHDLRFSRPPEPLASHPRTTCPRCEKSRRAWCNQCYELFIADPPARVALALAVDVLQHKSEKPGASSTVHLALMAPAHVRVFREPETVLPDYAEALGEAWREECAVLLPGDAAVALSELSVERLHGLKRLVVLDSNWAHAAPMMGKHPQLAEMARVQLDEPVDGDEADPRNTALRHGLFWRHKKTSGKTERKRLGEPDMWLSTAEAVYMAVTQIEQLRRARPLREGGEQQESLGEDKKEEDSKAETVQKEEDSVDAPEADRVTENEGIRTHKFDDLLWTYMIQHDEAIAQMSMRYDLVQEHGRPPKRQKKQKGGGPTVAPKDSAEGAPEGGEPDVPQQDVGRHSKPTGEETREKRRRNGSRSTATGS